MPKTDRIDAILRREISRILQFELKDPKLGFVTVTDVQCTGDLSIAKVYVSFLGKQERNDAGMKILNQSRGFIRSTIAKNVKMRKVPELQFFKDTSIEYGNRIEKKIREINEQDSAAAQDQPAADARQDAEA